MVASVVMPLAFNETAGLTLLPLYTAHSHSLPLKPSSFTRLSTGCHPRLSATCYNHMRLPAQQDSLLPAAAAAAAAVVALWWTFSAFALHLDLAVLQAKLLPAMCHTCCSLATVVFTSASTVTDAKLSVLVAMLSFQYMDHLSFCTLGCSVTFTVLVC